MKTIYTAIIHWFNTGALCCECREVRVNRMRSRCSFCDKGEGVLK